MDKETYRMTTKDRKERRGQSIKTACSHGSCTHAYETLLISCIGERNMLLLSSVESNKLCTPCI